jgi:hypothetical protein
MSGGKKEQVDALVRRARALCVTSSILRPLIMKMVTSDPDLVEEDWWFAQLYEHALEINKGGLRSQVFFLLEALGPLWAAKKLGELSSPLDEFTRRSTSSVEEPVEQEDADLDENGDPWE